MTCRLFHGVFTLHWLTTLMWLGLQGKGVGLMTSSPSFGGVNTTEATTTEQSKDLDTRPSKDPLNYTLGTKIIS